MCQRIKENTRKKLLSPVISVVKQESYLEIEGKVYKQKGISLAHDRKIVLFYFIYLLIYFRGFL